MTRLSDLLRSVPGEAIARVSQEILDVGKRDGTIYVCGDGGLAALSSHIEADFAKLRHARLAPKVVSLADNTALLTMIANDHGFESVFSYQLECQLTSADAVLLLSGSGQSRNLVRAAEVAKDRGAKVISLLGFGGGALARLSEIACVVPSSTYGLIEDVLHAIVHAVTDDLRRRALPSVVAVVLDRDGVLLQSPPLGTYIGQSTGYSWLPLAKESVRFLNELGLKVIVATNQRGVALGVLSMDAINSIHDSMRRDLQEVGARVDAFYVCPHGLDEGCRCRKPRTGMLESAAADFQFDPHEAVVIGDSDTDVAMAHRAGSRAIVVGENPIPGVDWSPSLSVAVQLVAGKHVVRTPLRVSFFGGGTDLPSFYRQMSGRVLSAAIDKYTFVILKTRFDSDVYANWMQKEIVSSVGELRHELIRECLRFHGIRNGIEVTTLADIPAGTGLASSSSITVGLLLGASVFQGQAASPDALAQNACHIEMDVLAKPIGRQDQYICAFGGLRDISFRVDDTVQVSDVELPAGRLQELEEQLMLFYTGTTRAADPILRDLNDRVPERMDDLRRMRDMVGDGIAALIAPDWASFGQLLDEGWRRKRSLQRGVSTKAIDEIYATARAAGALGGKVAGAGGGGFMLLFVPTGSRARVRAALKPLREIPIRVSAQGSRVVYFDDH